MNEHADAKEEKQPETTARPAGQAKGPDSTEPGSTMKHCFGVSMGWFMEDLVGEYHERLRCYNCSDFEACYKMSMVRTLTQLRYEVRRAARVVGLAIGGSHSAYPY